IPANRAASRPTTCRWPDAAAAFPQTFGRGPSGIRRCNREGASPMNPALANELAARAADGWHPVTLNEIKRQLRGLGYALDRSLDCRSTAQIMTGPRAGKTYPTLS